MKTVLSSFELRHLISELQFLVGAKIEKVFQQTKPKDDFLFSLHVPGKGKQYLFLSLPGLLCLSDFKPVFPDSPPGFCSSLRRKITNAKITSVSQQGFERIVVIGLSTLHGESKLVIELIPPGNMLLLDATQKILSVLHPKIWNDERALLPARQYTFPSLQFDPFSTSLEGVKELFFQSIKESIVKTLAIDASLGGVYAEEVVCRCGLEKTLSPNNLSEKQLLQITNALSEVCSQQAQPFVYNAEAFPILLQDISLDEVTKHATFNEAVASIALTHLTKAEESFLQKENTQALSKTDKILHSQRQMLVGLEQAEKDNQQKGELIYHHYAEIKVLLDKIRDLRKVASWDEIKTLCADVPLLVSIDEKTGTLYVAVE